VGGTRGFLYARFLLRIGHLPNLPPGINAVYMKWAGYSPALLILLTRRHATAGRRIGAQAVHERRGATDRGEYRQAAGASAEGVTAVSFYPSGVGSEGAHHHAATNSTCAVYCGLCRTCNHRLHSHAEAEKAPLTVASVWINNAARRFPPPWSAEKRERIRAFVYPRPSLEASINRSSVCHSRHGALLRSPAHCISENSASATTVPR